MAPRGRKAKAKAAPVLPHGMGLDLSAKAKEASSATKPSSVAETPAITTAAPIARASSAQPAAPQDKAIPQKTENQGLITFKVSRPTRSTGVLGIKATEEQPDPASVETHVLQTSARQLRPRKSKETPISPSAEEVTPSSTVEDQNAEGQSNKGASNKRKRQAKNASDQEFNPNDSEPKPKKARKKARKTKDNPYGLTPGESPFPEWLAPSAEQCEEVYNLLKALHTDVKAEAPEVIPAPSLEVTGCGEVPSVLDALLRTYLSGAVTMKGSNKMLENLAARFGTSEDGIGKATINWDNVRLSPQEDLVSTIREGGLANIKAKHIKEILDMVHQENVERRGVCLEEKMTVEQADESAAGEKADGQKDLETQMAEQNTLSLEHIRSLSVDGAMKQFTKYPGIGVKTSACVVLFCLQMPCFAVDTHVHRFAKWLGWAPETATADDVFSHLEVRCPDRFKYGLHQLFIRHGQNCGKCNASTAEGTEDWLALEDCPLEGLVNRFSKRKSKAQPKPPKKGKGAKKEEEEEGEKEMKEHEEEPELKHEDDDRSGSVHM
ncbi:DNA glycosylase [Hypoxylon sp. FL1857]|nr:DNA glycosylase [Hypoxylon sp. FL1857]